MVGYYWNPKPWGKQRQEDPWGSDLHTKFTEVCIRWEREKKRTQPEMLRSSW